MKSLITKASDVLLLADYYTTAEIAEELGVSPPTARDWCKKLGVTPVSRRNGKPWSEKEDAIITKGWAKGDCARIIAQKLPNRNRDMVIGRAHRLGLPRHERTTQGLKQ